MGGVLDFPYSRTAVPSLSRVTISFPSLSRTMSLSSVARAIAATSFDPGGPGEAAAPGDFPAPIYKHTNIQTYTIRQCRRPHEFPLWMELPSWRPSYSVHERGLPGTESPIASAGNTSETNGKQKLHKPGNTPTGLVLCLGWAVRGVETRKHRVSRRCGNLKLFRGPSGC